MGEADKYSEAQKKIMEHIKQDNDGNWVTPVPTVVAMTLTSLTSQVWEVYEEWSIAGDPVEVMLANGTKRKTWPMNWTDLSATLKKVSVHCGQTYNPVTARPRLGLIVYILH